MKGSSIAVTFWTPLTNTVEAVLLLPVTAMVRKPLAL
jgi:hypothetical protein